MLIDYGLELVLALFIGGAVAGYMRGLKRGTDDAVEEHTMTNLTIAGLDAELFVLDPPSTSAGVRYQFRMVTPDREFFTHEVAITASAFVAEKGYSQDADACLEDAQRVVEELVAAGRFEDLVVTHGSSGWHDAKPAPAPLKKHSSKVPRQLGAILDVLDLTEENLRKSDPQSGENRHRVAGWLYRILDTLDSKTAHLVAVSSLLLAAQTFLAGIVFRDRGRSADYTLLFDWPDIRMVVLLLLLVPLTAASIGSLSIIRVEWRFFGKVRPRPESERDDPLIKVELRALAETCDKRFDRYRVTMFGTGASLLAFFLSLLLALTTVW